MEAVSAFDVSSTVRPPHATAVGLEDGYMRMSARGYGHGPAFQGLRELHRTDAVLYALASLPDAAGTSDGFYVHPALLDALAKDFIDHKFDLRHLMRTILNSRAYQLSAEPNDSNRGDTRNYPHFQMRRLIAEVMLDAMSQATGAQEKFAGYPPETRATQVYGGGGGYMLASFGRLNRDIICERDSQPDMAQTMHLISGNTVQKKIAAAKIDLALSDDELIERIYRSSLVRGPSEEERAAIRDQIAKGDRKAVYQDLLWAILNSKEFMYQH